MESTARLVAADGPTARATHEDKQQALNELVMALGSVLRARGKRYVMANVPRAKLEQVKQVLPGLNGPTVVDMLRRPGSWRCTPSWPPRASTAPSPRSRRWAARASSSPASRG